MEILVYLGSRMGNDEDLRQSVVEIADWIGKNNHNLVYGGNSGGLMGVLAKRVKEHNRKVTGVMPHFLLEFERLNKEADEIIMTDTMQERKDKMRELSDVCIAIPGGAGTLEEITEAYSLFNVKQNTSPCIVYNKNGYYNPLKEMYDKIVEFGFLEKEKRENLLFSDDFEEIEKFIAERLSKWN